jgi:acyl carrier protein
MIPSAVMLLDRLPINANGKVDRAALPEPPAETASASLPQSSELERKISEIWSATLGRAAGPDQSFFDLGGGSLQLIEVHAAICGLIGRELPITELFEYTTVRTLARRLAGNAETPEPLERAGDRATRRNLAFERIRLARAARP